MLKAEAIVSPEMLAPYLGGHDRFRPECDLAYDNQLMVMLWSSLATRDVRLAERALSHRRPAPVATSWVTYVRCHDDIGWAVSDADAAAAGIDGFAHRRFLADFYAGRFPGSFGRGALFQDNPVTGDARISGMAASLCGVQAALEAGDPGGLTAAIRRLEAMYAIAFSFGGIPLIYMGDELAMRSDAGWAGDPAHAHDNRWMHRPLMDWDLAEAGTTRTRWKAGCSPRSVGWPTPGARCSRCGPAAAPRSCRPRTAACCPIAGRTRAARRFSR